MVDVGKSVTSETGIGQHEVTVADEAFIEQMRRVIRLHGIGVDVHKEVSLPQLAATGLG